VRYFKKVEFACSHCGKNNMDAQFLHMIDEARNVAGIPFKVNSGFRCKEHNKAVGGKEHSSHLKGMAADISCTNSRDRMRIVNACLMVGFRRIGIAKTFIHIDNDLNKGSQVMWLY